MKELVCLNSWRRNGGDTKLVEPFDSSKRDALLRFVKAVEPESTEHFAKHADPSVVGSFDILLHLVVLQLKSYTTVLQRP